MPSETPMQWDYDHTSEYFATNPDNNHLNNQERQSPVVAESNTNNMAPKRSISTSQTKCTACCDSIETSAAARIHPLIGVLVCRKCYDSYGDGNFEQLEDGVDEAGDDNFCRWCVDGGDLFVCMNDKKKPTDDKCHYCFCRDCLERNVPDDPILSADTSIDPNFKWHCYACDPTKLTKLRKDALEVLQKLTGKKAENLTKKRKTDDNPTVTKTKVPIPTHKPAIAKKLSLTTPDVKIGTTISKTNVVVIGNKLNTSTTSNKSDTTAAIGTKTNNVANTKKADSTISSNKEPGKTINKDLTASKSKESTTTNNIEPVTKINLPPSATGNKDLLATNSKDVTSSANKNANSTSNKILAPATSNKMDTSITGKKTIASASSIQVDTTTTTNNKLDISNTSNNKLDATTASKDKSSSTNRVLNSNQTSISSSSKENTPTLELLKRLEVYRKTKDLAVEEISSKFDMIVNLVSKESNDRLLKVQIEGLKTSMLEFETMIDDLKSELILKD